MQELFIIRILNAYTVCTRPIRTKSKFYNNRISDDVFPCFAHALRYS